MKPPNAPEQPSGGTPDPAQHGAPDPGEATRTATRDAIDGYFAALRDGSGWQDRLADDVVFTSHGTPPKRVVGRAAVVASTAGFYGMIERLEVKDILVDGQRACARTRYRLRPAAAPPFDSDVAEVFRVASGRVAEMAIYFDSAPYPVPGSPSRRRSPTR